MSTQKMQDNFFYLISEGRKFISSDWQLQASAIGLAVFAVLVLLINCEWNKHKANLMNLDLDREILQARTPSSDKLLKVDSFNKYDYDRIQFPDEDPLTFVKKRS